jgi:hypothetical protein
MPRSRKAAAKEARETQEEAELRADRLELRQAEAGEEADAIVTRCEAIIAAAHDLYDIPERKQAAKTLAQDAHRVIGYAKAYGRNIGEPRTGKGLTTQTDNMERRLYALQQRDER